MDAPDAGPRAARQDGVRLLRRDARFRAVAVAAAGAAVTGLLGWRVAGDKTGGRVDHVLARFLEAHVPVSHGVGGLFGQAVAQLGSPVPVAVGMVALGVLAWWWRGPRAVAFVLAGPAVAMTVTATILQPITGRTRGETLAYPSGHTTAVASIALAVGVLVWSSTLPRRMRTGLVATLGLLVVLTATTLVARNVHWPSDVLGALGVALAVVLPTAIVVDAAADDLTDEPDPLASSATTHPLHASPADAVPASPADADPR